MKRERTDSKKGQKRTKGQPKHESKSQALTPKPHEGDETSEKITPNHKLSEQYGAPSSIQKQIRRDDHYDTDYKPRANRIDEIKQYDQKISNKKPTAFRGTRE